MTTERVRRSRHLSLVARAAVAILAIGWVLHDQDWAELGAVFRRLDPWYFALALAIYALAQSVIAFRWWVLLRAQSVHIPILATFRLHFVGLFYNNVMPGSVGGDLLKAWYVAKHTHRRLEGAFSVFVDRVVGLGGMVLMAIATYLLFLRGQNLEVATRSEDGSPQGAFRYGQAMLWGVAAIVAVAAAVLLHPRGRRRALELAAKVWRRGWSLVGRTRDALAVYCSKPWTMLCAVVLTMISQSVVVVSFWLLGRNMAIAAGLEYYFVVFPVTWVIGAIPVSIAGLGVLEAGIVELFTRLTSAPAESALALALCQRFIWVIASLPGGVVHLVGGHLPKEFFVDGQGTLN
ncbi:MAG: flippase-like domain-containing protein [Sedimentisphaerales bacterium]|nr:flippase-like domain-containing protein [Sedimentisphaerales bacterium]